MNMNERFVKVNEIHIKDLPKLGDVLDTLIDGIRHVEAVDMIYRYMPDEDAKSVSAVLYTARQKLDEAHGQLEHLFTWKAEAAA